ncbi:MAG: hypothetical protein DMG15_06990 [Acidobacteria bacterium]|nr:MAG: hypothetical protein DMG15_06990 [Acidobacteriota bacterium]
MEPTRKPRGSSLRRQVPTKTDVYLPNVLHFLDNRQTGDVLKDPEVSIWEGTRTRENRAASRPSDDVRRAGDSY